MDKEDEHEFEESRRCLINSYHSYVQNHAGLLIAIIIGELALISEWKNFFDNGSWSLLSIGIFFSLIGFVFLGFVFISSRMNYWTKYSDAALSITQEDVFLGWEKNAKKPKGKSPYTSMINYAASHMLWSMVFRRENDRFGFLDEKTLRFAIKISRCSDPDK